MIGEWNRAYGSHGFLSTSSSSPGGRRRIKLLLADIAASGHYRS